MRSKMESKLVHTIYHHGWACRPALPVEVQNFRLEREYWYSVETNDGDFDYVRAKKDTSTPLSVHLHTRFLPGRRQIWVLTPDQYGA